VSPHPWPGQLSDRRVHLVTTIPAAASIGVSIAFSSWGEDRGSMLRLLLSVVVLIVSGAEPVTASGHHRSRASS
jgi:hypothetical protein